MRVLRVERLSKDFGGVRAIQDVSFQVDAGERLGIIGPNGAGKTTLFNILGGQLSPSAGRVLYNDKDITKLPPHKRTFLGISRSFQIAALFDDLSVLDNILLSFQGTRHSRFHLFKFADSYSELMLKAEEMLDSLDLWEQRNEPVFSISYGEKRKLEIALSLVSEPRLLLLDEPSCGLTTSESDDIKNRIRDLGGDITVLLVAHDMDLVFGVAERILVLHFGRIITQGTCEEIYCDEKVKELYMGSEEGFESA